MALTSHVDLGQVLTGLLIGIVGWFIKKEITNFGNRLDKHEAVILEMANKLSTVAGEVSMWAKMFAMLPERKVRDSDRTNG